MNKENKQILFAFLILLVFGILVVFVFDVNCIFKSITDLPCPGCGLTRGFRSLFSGHIIKAESYNILTIPIFLFLLLCAILFLLDIFQKTDRTELLLKKLAQYYKLIIVLVVINWIINIIRGI